MYFKNIFTFTFAAVLCCITINASAQKEYWKNGNRKSETTHTEDYTYTTQWYENGTKLSEGAMRYEKRVGTWLFWHENGKPQFSMFYDSLATEQIKASKQGVIVRITTYTAEGKLERVENYSDGLPLVNSEYYANGQLKQIVNHENGLPTGGIRWFENGSINEMFSFQKVYKTEDVAGRETTKINTEKLTYKEWFHSGKIALDGQVDIQGQRTGVWHKYDGYGNILQTIEN